MEEKEGSITKIGSVRKADTQSLITNGADAFPEDDFTGQYWTQGTAINGVSIIEPTYKPGVLHALTTQNNILSQCVEAMEVNIDGTGHSIDLIDHEGEDDETEKAMLEEFFKEPFPGKSMIEIRRALRRDIESTGNGYMEVIRYADDNIAMLNVIDCNEMRLIRMDDAVDVVRPIVRGGKEVNVRIKARERRFIQFINGKKVYFKEFNASRDLDRNTGLWSKNGERLPVDKRASEILHFKGNNEPKTPYGAPRWINQLPSVLGSRKAEEVNLEFFDGGGIPPLLILIEGGTIGTTVKNELKQHLSGKGNKDRAAIVEIASSSGTIDVAGKVNVRVERFSGEKQGDSLFQNYDKETAEHVRVAFRLPPIFLGKAADYSFASAYTSYMVAEAQVFFPERDEFDSKINNTILRAMKVTKYKYRSLPVTLVDVANQLKALELVLASQIVSGDGIVKGLNDITGLSMEYTKPPEPPAQSPQAEVQTPPEKYGTGMSNALTLKGETLLPEHQGTLIEDRILKLASDWVDSNGLVCSETKNTYSSLERSLVAQEVSQLRAEDARVFNQLVVFKSLVRITEDIDSLAELCGCVTHTLN